MASTTMMSGTTGNISQGSRPAGLMFAAVASSTPRPMIGGRRPRPRKLGAVSPRTIDGLESVDAQVAHSARVSGMTRVNTVADMATATSVVRFDCPPGSPAYAQEVKT